MDPLDRWKMVYGFGLLAGLLGLGFAIALGKVEEKTSYGLQQIIAALILLCGAFAQWAFQVFRKLESTEKKENTGNN